MPVLFHGDASFAGQGVCYETMQLMHVKEMAASEPTQESPLLVGINFASRDARHSHAKLHPHHSGYAFLAAWAKMIQSCGCSFTEPLRYSALECLGSCAWSNAEIANVGRCNTVHLH
eukprot:1135915-Amphidinium_carterae.1